MMSALGQKQTSRHLRKKPMSKIPQEQVPGRAASGRSAGINDLTKMVTNTNLTNKKAASSATLPCSSDYLFWSPFGRDGTITSSSHGFNVG
jgi:hypothetical protein